MRNCARRRQYRCSRYQRVGRPLRPPLCRKIYSRFTTIWSPAPGSRQVRQCWFTVGPAVSAARPSCWLGHSPQSRSPAGSDEKCAACLELGAVEAINYRTQDFVEIGRRFTGERGVDVILDMVGGSYLDKNL